MTYLMAIVPNIKQFNIWRDFIVDRDPHRKTKRFVSRYRETNSNLRPAGTGVQMLGETALTIENLLFLLADSGKTSVVA
jgi:hypothetical protein